MSKVRMADGRTFDEDTGVIEETVPASEPVAEPVAEPATPSAQVAEAEVVTDAEAAAALEVHGDGPRFAGLLALGNGQSLDLSIIAQIGMTFAAAGFWKDARRQSEAMAKLILGLSLGLSPVASMTDLDIVQGRPRLRSHALAALIAQSGRYRYRVTTSDETVCEIAWSELLEGEWVEVGSSSFTIDEAARAGLTGKDAWKAYPADMLYARALSRGARRFAPAATGGTVYIEGEVD